LHNKYILLTEAVEVISNPNETLENKEIAFDNLEMVRIIFFFHIKIIEIKHGAHIIFNFWS
jgi:hypothetical protein